MGYNLNGFCNIRPVFFKNPDTLDPVLAGLTSTIKAVRLAIADFWFVRACLFGVVVERGCFSSGLAAGKRRGEASRGSGVSRGRGGKGSEIPKLLSFVFMPSVGLATIWARADCWAGVSGNSSELTLPDSGAALGFVGD